MDVEWITLPAAAALLGWTLPPSSDHARLFADHVRDGHIRYRAIEDGTLTLINPILDFERSTALARTKATRGWASIERRKVTVALPILVHADDIKALKSELRGSAVRMTTHQNAEAACAAWIAGLPQDPIMTRAQIWEEAAIKFKNNLSDRALQRAWDKSAPTEWRKPGKRSNLST